MVAAAFPRDGGALFFQKLELDRFAGRNADVIIPVRILVYDLVVHRPDRFCRIPVPQLADIARQIHILPKGRRRVVDHEADADLVSGQYLEVVVHVACRSGGVCDFNVVDAACDGRNFHFDLRVFPRRDVGAAHRRRAEVDGAFARAEAAAVDRDRHARLGHHRPDMPDGRRRRCRGVLPHRRAAGRKREIGGGPAGAYR